MLQPCVILTQPQLSENIGMTARAMWNCGLDDLRLVTPLQSPLADKAVAAATNAARLLQKAKIYDSLPEALADCHYALATTARPRELDKPVITAAEGAAKSAEKAAEGQKIAFVFGREKSGLTNDELSYVDEIVSIPLNPEFSSLNIAQAVLLVGYEWYKTAGENKRVERAGFTPERADKGQLQTLFDHLTYYLDESGYFVAPQKRDLLLEKVRHLFQRAELSHHEVLMLHGMIKALAVTEIQPK